MSKKVNRFSRSKDCPTRWVIRRDGRILADVWQIKPGRFHWDTFDGRNTHLAGERPKSFAVAKCECLKHLRWLEGVKANA